MTSDLFNLATKSIDSSAESCSRVFGPKSVNVFDVQDHTNGIYKRNTHCWARFAYSTLAAISPWNTYGANKKCGTAVAPDILIEAIHSSYMLKEGSTVRFVTSSNKVVDRVVGPYRAIGDIAVTKLVEPLPDEIKPLKVLPKNWREKLPEIDNTGKYSLPVLFTDQNERACITDWYQSSGGLMIYRKPKTAPRLYYYKDLIQGDSGNPALLALEYDLILLSCWSTPVAGPDVSYYTDQINDAMNQLGSKHQLTPAW